MRTALFIGGTGSISMSVTQCMAARKDWKIVLLNRGKSPGALPDGAEALIADIHNDAEVRAVLGGRRFDVVADFIAFRPEHIARDIELFSGRTRQYIFISSASAYQKPTTSLPITESTPLHNPFWQYSRDKMLCEHALMKAYRENGFPAVIVRPSHTYNYRNCALALTGKQRGWQTILRIREGKPVIIHGDGTSLWTLTHAEDFAVGFGGLMGDPRTVGHAFHITSDDVLTWNTILELLAGALGAKLNPLHIAADRIIKSNPEYEGPLLGDKAHSVIFDNAKIRRFVPEFRPAIKYADAVHHIVETMTGTPALQIPDPEFDAWCDGMAEKER